MFFKMNNSIQDSGIKSWYQSWRHFRASSVILGIVVSCLFLQIAGSLNLKMSAIEQYAKKCCFAIHSSIKDTVNAWRCAW
jgi:hypothetical protein